MSVTPVNVCMTYGATPPGDRFTAPAVCVVNMFPASSNYQAGGADYFMCQLAINGVCSLGISAPTGPHVGPFVFNAGDVLTYYVLRGIGPQVASIAGAGGTLQGAIPKLGISGEAYGSMTTKIPFGVLIKQGTSTYTVPAGKLARFNAFPGGEDITEISQPVAGQGCILVDGNNVANTLNASIGQYVASSSTGPIIAGAGSVISVTNVWANTIGKAYLNGWLYNA